MESSAAKIQAAQPKLWNRNFILVLIGQLMSVFGNGVIRLALPLYILYVTGNPALLGLITAASAIPLLAMTPIGGALADRLRKKRIMLCLDAFVTVIIVLFMAATGIFAMTVPLVLLMLGALNAVQGIYAPTVDASVPVIVPTGMLVRANSAVMAIHTLSALGAPAVAGILLGRFGISSIIAIGAVFFAIATLVDLFIRIPHKKQGVPEGGIWQAVKADVSRAGRFVAKEKPAIARCFAAIFLPGIAINGTLIVGLQVLITQHLGMGTERVGLSQSIIAAGILAGSVIVGLLGPRLKLKQAPLYMLLCCIFIAPIGLVFLFGVPPAAAYIIITAASAVTFAILQPLVISAFSFVQAETPIELMGKVVSLFTMIPALAGAVGALIFGRLFGIFAESPYIVVLLAVAIVFVSAILARILFRKI